MNKISLQDARIYPVSICGQIVDLCLLMEKDKKARLHLSVNHVLPLCARKGCQGK